MKMNELKEGKQDRAEYYVFLADFPVWGSFVSSHKTLEEARVARDAANATSVPYQSFYIKVKNADGSIGEEHIK